MKTLLATLLTVPSLLIAQQQNYSFGNILWNADDATVKQGMMQQGMTFTNIDSDGDLNFSGSLMGYKAAAAALMTPTRQLVKTILLIYVDDTKARSVYRELKEVLTTKYGVPVNCFEFFKKPYEEGDGYEEQAIKLDKAVFSCFWGDMTHENGKGSISLEITNKLNLRVTYEGPTFVPESDRRKAKATKAF